MLFSLVCFTANTLLLKYLGTYRQVDAWYSLFFRAAAGLAVVAVLFAPRKQVDFKRATFGKLMVWRGILGALGTAAYYLTLPHLGAGKATLISNTWVIWSAILAVYVLGESLGLRKMGGTLLAMAGIVLLTGLERGDVSQFGTYEIMAVVGSIIAAGVVVVIRQLTRTDTSATIYASQCVYTGALSLPLILHAPVPSGMDLALLALCGILASGGQLGLTEGFRYLPISAGGAFQILLPLVITAGSMLVFTEPFTTHQAYGALIILAGCYLTVTAPAPPPPSPRLRTKCAAHWV